MAFKILATLIFSLLLTCCGVSEREKVAFKKCYESVKYVDIYEKDGTHLSNTSEGYDFAITICSARARLYDEGYRISLITNSNDWKVYQAHLFYNHSVYGIYKESIKKGIDP